MTRFTETNTEGFTSSDLAVLNAAYDQIMQNVSAEFEGGTNTVSDGLSDAWVEGDTVDTLVARFNAQHPSI